MANGTALLLCPWSPLLSTPLGGCKWKAGCGILPSSLSRLVLTESAGEGLLTMETLARLLAVSRERRSHRGDCRLSARAPPLGARTPLGMPSVVPLERPQRSPRCPKASGDVVSQSQRLRGGVSEGQKCSR